MCTTTNLSCHELHCCRISQYIACHRRLLAQQVPPPSRGQLGRSLERFHLMNFGFDPLRDAELAGK